MTRTETRYFGIFFDRFGEPSKYVALDEYIKGDPDIPAWWHYMRSGYIVKTTKTAKDLRGEIKEYLGDDSFLVIEVDPRNSDGWLPERAWQWFKRHADVHEHAENVN